MAFSFQQAESSSSSDDEAFPSPPSELVSDYNRDYSLIYSQVESFLKQMSESINRYVTYNRFGAGLQLSNILDKLQQLQHTVDFTDPKVRARKKFELSFESIVVRMGSVLQDLLHFEFLFKKQYFGMMEKQSLKAKCSKFTKMAPKLQIEKPSERKKNKPYSNSSRSQQESKRTEQCEAELRESLQSDLKIPHTFQMKECQRDRPVGQNIEKLTTKVQNMMKQLQQNKCREEKIVKLFQITRMKNLYVPPDKSILIPPEKTHNADRETY